MAVVAKQLKYSEYGDPTEVLKISEVEVPDPKDDEVLVKVLAAPLNPVDFKVIQGIYAVKPPLPAVGGNELVGVVLKVGQNVKGLQSGDRVVSFTPGLGTWTSHGVYPAKDLIKISSKIGIAEAATLTVNPCTAYRMLKDFVNLKPGDTIIQNGANSGVGQAIHELCKAWNINSVGVVRNRPEINEVKAHLKRLGATEVFTEEEIRSTDIFEGKLKKPVLALNCVGGKSAAELARHLDDKGFLIIYGGISREPVIVDTGAFIYKDISVRGFWLWSKDNLNSVERPQMFAELCQLIEEGKLNAPVHELVPLERYKEAVGAGVDFKGFAGKKYIFDFQK